MSETTARPVLVTPEVMAEMLGISRSRVFLLIANGEIRSVKIGRLRRIPVEEIQRYADDLVESEYGAASPP